MASTRYFSEKKTSEEEFAAAADTLRKLVEQPRLRELLGVFAYNSSRHDLLKIPLNDIDEAVLIDIGAYKLTAAETHEKSVKRTLLPLGILAVAHVSLDEAALANGCIVSVVDEELLEGSQN